MRAVLLVALSLSACATTPAAVPAQEAHEDAAMDPAIAEAYKRAYDSADLALYTQAKDQHAAWLAAHPGTKAEREVRGQYAKLLFALGAYREAADEFNRVAALAKGGAADYVARGALRNLVLSRLYFAKEGTTPKTPLRLLRERGRADKVMLAFNIDSIALPDYSQPNAPKEAAIPASEKALAEACDAYLAVAEPEDGALPTIALLGAWVHFAHGHVEDGAARCGDLVARWPHNDIAVSCVRAATGGLAARRSWAALEKHARAFRGNLSLIGADHELERYLEQLVQVATFGRIQTEAEKQAKDAEAERQNLIAGAEAFRAYQREFPYSDNADKALYNAFVYLARAARRDDARAVGEVFLAQYGSSDLVGAVRRGMKQLEPMPTANRDAR